LFEALASERRWEARTAPTTPPWWNRAMQHLKEQRQALTAVVFQEANHVWFDDNTLWVWFPEDSDFHAREARKPRHVEALQDAVEAVSGSRPTEVLCMARGG
jgi:hypothetical protein